MFAVCLYRRDTPPFPVVPNEHRASSLLACRPVRVEHNERSRGGYEAASLGRVFMTRL